MAIRVRFKHSREGIGEVLRSVGVQEVLHAKGEAVAEKVRAAGIRVDGVPGDVELPVTVNTTGKGTRARTYVTLDHPSGAAVEAKHGVLTSSIDAAKDA
ncbi:hypothetical protein [Micromonospora sp. DT227]|uniref:hypothetical protein n=1 Tax=Micromonospora sp. DT227 TaxID=3393433 RepID=UPI003CF480DC